MKNIRLPFSAFIFCALLFSSGIGQGQSVMINSVSGTKFCAGDSLSVTFIVTGTWGHNNAFTLQLSNVSGTFNNGFTRLGSVIDTVPGSFTFNTSIPPATPYSSHYRVRVIGAYPYTESADNGSDILIGEKPSHVTWKPSVLESAIAVGVPIKFNMFNFSTSNDTEHVDFGAGATQSGAGVTYNSPGLKKIVIESVAPGGCSVKDSFQVYAFGCDNPVIPHDAIIVSRDTIFTDNDQSNKTFWLNPGVSLTLGRNESDTIFAEAGSSVSGQNGGQTDDIVYLKKGASSDPDFYGVVVYQPGSSLTNTNGSSIRTVECPDLMFDYSAAPPNKAFPQNGVLNTDDISKAITISPNPTRGIISIQGTPLNYLNISVLNLLGETMMQLKNLYSPNFTLDLSNLVAGTYYIRFSSANSVVTKMVVRE